MVMLTLVIKNRSRIDMKVLIKGIFHVGIISGMNRGEVEKQKLMEFEIEKLLNFR